jgi:hypothetical protein
MVVALMAGAVIGGWAGAYMHGSGMFYSDLLVGAVVLVVIAIAGVGAVVATYTDRSEMARTLTGFVVMTVVATGALFIISPPYRGPNPGVEYFGRATMRIAELPPFEWPMGSRCKILDNETSVFSAEVNLRANAKQQVSASMGFVPSGWRPQPGIGISLVTMEEDSPISPAFYTANFGSGADVVMDSADGLRGHLRFSANLEPDQFRTPKPDEPARLTGTLEWDCTASPPGPSVMPEGTHDGSLDLNAHGDRCYANGWASDPDDRSRRVMVRVLVDGTQAWSEPASESRPDVAAAGHGDGRSGFWVQLDRSLKLGVDHEIRVQALDAETGRWVDLNATPKTLGCN